MKKTLIIGLILSISMMFISCGSNEAEKSIEQAIESMENKEYDKALVLLEIALDEDADNKEATKLYDIVDTYNKANKEIENKNIDKAKETLDKIDKDYINYSIKKDIDTLKKEIELQLKESKKVEEYLKEAEQLIQDHKYDNAKNILYNNILGLKGNTEPNKYASKNQNEKAIALIKKCDEAIAEIEKLEEEERERQKSNIRAQYIQKLDAIEVELSYLEDMYLNGKTFEMLEAGSVELGRWDDMLNEIYDLLKVQLSEAEMNEVTEKQINWLEYRDSTANNASAEFKGGTLADVVRLLTLGELTKERCYELVNLYMK